MIGAYNIGYLSGTIDQRIENRRLESYAPAAKRDIAFYAQLESEGLLECYGESARSRILAFIAEYADMHGTRPTQRAIAMALGVSQSYVSSVCREPRL